MADGGGARPESERGRGFRWPEAAVRPRGAVGSGVALERGIGEEWVMEERTASRVQFENGRSTARQRGRGVVRTRECHTARGGVVGPGPDRRAVLGSGPSAARAGDVRRALCRPETERGWVLTGGPLHSVGRLCR
jgi:hypothetical protein